MEVFTIKSRCPLKTAKYISDRDEFCREDCAWLISDTNGNKACAVACLAARGNCYVANPLVANVDEDAKPHEYMTTPKEWQMPRMVD